MIVSRVYDVILGSYQPANVVSSLTLNELHMKARTRIESYLFEKFYKTFHFNMAIFIHISPRMS